MKTNINTLPELQSEVLTGSKNQNINSDIWALINSLEINETTKAEKPPVLFKYKDSELFTAGNFSTIIGKAKSRKSFFITLIASILIENNSTDFETPFDGLRVCYIDTEQSSYHCGLVYERISRLTSKLQSFKLYGLKTLPTAKRLEAFQALASSGQFDVVILDGLRDVVTSINDESEATKIMDIEMQLCEKHKIHIINILHENKNDSNARGHVGTEAVNKSETVLRITKENDVSIVESEYLRSVDFEKFSFRIESGLPVYNGEVEKKRTKKEVIAYVLTNKLNHDHLINFVFDKQGKSPATIDSLIETWFIENLETELKPADSAGIRKKLIENQIIKNIGKGAKSALFALS